MRGRRNGWGRIGGRRGNEGDQGAWIAERFGIELYRPLVVLLYLDSL